jgi:phosphonopyruvate decarboxylase
MINVRDFCDSLQDAGISFYTGVPDSLLAELCSCLSHLFKSDQHVICANEGNAIGMAIGHFLATGSPALVYMQNSGLGNALNPLVSLAAHQVYSIPMLLVIGWRGEIDDHGVQIKDEPQHEVQGKITKSLLDLLEIPFYILDKDSDIFDIVSKVTILTKRLQRPIALLVRKNVFQKYTPQIIQHKTHALTRAKSLEIVISSLNPSIPVISTTGKLSRELYEIRKKTEKNLQRDFLTVGGMGHASSIATGFANSYAGKVACLDGDGAIIMHMGALTNSAKCNNMIHIVFNNGAHESVGGQPTKGLELSLKEIALKCGYAQTYEAISEESICEAINIASQQKSSVFIEIICSNSSLPELGRPESSTRKNRNDFMTFVREDHD